MVVSTKNVIVKPRAGDEKSAGLECGVPIAYGVGMELDGFSIAG